MNKISEFINKHKGTDFKFSPSKEFYTSTNIKQKRFGQLYRKEKSPTLDEIQAIAEYFKVDVKELL